MKIPRLKLMWDFFGTLQGKHYFCNGDNPEHPDDELGTNFGAGKKNKAGASASAFSLLVG